METLRTSLDNVTPSQILSHFGFHIELQTGYYIIYTSQKLKRSYSLFRNPECETMIFNPARFEIIDKLNLFLALINPTTPNEVASAVDQIRKAPAIDPTPSLPAIESHKFLTRVAALRKPTPAQFPLANSPQFHNRVFATRDGQLSIPLYAIHPTKLRSDKIINFIHIKDNDFTYYNSTRDWLTTTCYHPDNRFLVVTSDPAFFAQYLTNNYGPEFFIILCHPHLTETVFRSILLIRDNLSFSRIFLPDPLLTEDSNFITNALVLFLNAYVDNLVFTNTYIDQNCSLSIYSIEAEDHAAFIAEIVHDANTSTLQAPSGEELDRHFADMLAIELSTVDTELKKLCVLAYRLTPILSKTIFKVFTSKFGVDKKITLLASRSISE